MTKLGVLEKIELELKQELARLGDCSAVIALGPHRTAFDKILKEVRSIKPILIKVKHAYDIALKEADNIASHVNPLKSLVATLAEEYEQKLLDVKQSGRDELNSIKSQNENLQNQVEQRDLTNLDLQRQIERLQKEVGELYKNYREEKSARRLLISDLSGRNTNDVKPTSDKDEIDPVHMKIALEQTRIDLGIARKEIMVMEADYVNVVPKRKFDELEDTYNITLAAKNEFDKNYKSLSQEHGILRATYNQVSTERDVAVAENLNLTRAGTPRPEWSEVAEVVSSEMFSAISGETASSVEKVKQLVVEMKELKSASGPDYITVAKGSDLPKEGEEKEDIPIFLQTEKSQIRNRRMTSSETAQFIKLLWSSKLAKPDEIIEWPQFIQKELLKRYNEAADEFAHSFYDALTRHSTKFPHFNSFLKILTGKQSETEHTRIIEQSADFLKSLQKRDPNDAGVVSTDIFEKATKQTFKLKTADDLAALKNLCYDDEVSRDEIAYSALFLEDEVGAPSPIFRLLHEQDLKSKTEYIGQVALQLEGIDKTSVSEAKIAFMSIDPGINAEIINRYIKFGLGDADSIETEKFLQNLSNHPVYRVSAAVEF